MQDSNKDSNNKDGDDEQRFLRMFSKQLADALRAKDEEEVEERERTGVGASNKNISSSLNNKDETKDWERLRTSYVELCHDDPIVSGGNGDCRRLAKALVPKQQQKKSTSRLLNPKAAVAKSKTDKLGLSSRLVDGILQATSRATSKAGASSSASNNATQNDKNNDATDTEEQSMFSPSITTSEGYAEIAFAIFVEGPYRCIQKAEDLQNASNFLGSFLPSNFTQNEDKDKLDAEERSRLVDEATAKLVSGLENIAIEGTENEVPEKGDGASSSSSEFFTSKPAPKSRLDDDNDSMQEIFAEESDSDDYDFGPSCAAYNTTSDVQEIFGQKDNVDLSFDPLKLSEPNKRNQTWQGGRKSIHHLLSNASYGALSLGSISSRAWSECDMSETLADLTFMLLLENRDQDGTNLNSLISQDCSEDIAALWDRPLFLLRDRALDLNHGHDALPSYLQLLAGFLSNSEEQDVMSILSSPTSKSQQSDNNCTLPPGTTVGLSSLASLCSSKEMISAASGRMCGTSMYSVCPREEVKKTIMSSLCSLASILESVRPRKSAFGKSGDRDELDDNSTWIRTAVCVISIIEYLTDLQSRFDFQPLFEGGGSRSTTLSGSDAKEISDSGLFREMLSLFTSTRSEGVETGSGESPNAEDVVRMQLLRTLYTLSAQSPEYLGRYAVRVPEFAKEVHSSTFLDNNLVDGILWTSIGSSLLENKTDIATTSAKPRLKLRANSKLATKVSKVDTSSLVDRSINGFETMCTSSKKALEDIKHLVENTESRAQCDAQKKEYDACKVTLGYIKRFSNCLSNCPSATNLWLDSLKNDQDATSKARKSLSELKSTLTSLPSSIDKEVKTSHQDHKKDDDNDNCTDSSEDDILNVSDKKIQSQKEIQREYRSIVAQVRASVKVIALALESSRESGGLSLKGPVPYTASSKTD